jgi:DNA-directed RNA polymerase specialized sigma24 family protein
MKLEGYSNDEIARAISRSLPTVERRLRVIREIWGTEPTDE